MIKRLRVLLIMSCMLFAMQSMSQSYEALWTRYDRQDHYLVQDANRLLDTIEQKALLENDEYQLLKVCIQRISIC